MVKRVILTSCLVLLGIILFVKRPRPEVTETAQHRTKLERVSITGLSELAEDSGSSLGISTPTLLSTTPSKDIKLGQIDRFAVQGDSYILYFQDGSLRTFTKAQTAELPGNIKIRLGYSHATQ